MCSSPYSIEEQWKKCSEAFNAVADKTLGYKERPTRSPWFDEECLQVTAYKNEAYMKMLQHHTRRSAQIYGERRREEK